MHENKYHILIAGTGALACRFGEALTRVSWRQPLKVTLAGSWAAQIALLRSEGLFVRDEDGSVRNTRLDVHDDWQSIAPADVTLVLVKSWQTASVAPKIAVALKPTGIALTLQNGLGNCEALAAVLGENRLLQGITTAGANFESPGHLRLAGKGTTVMEHRPEMAEKIERLSAIFNEAGLFTQLSADIKPLVWQKLAVNAAINPLTALHNLPNGALLKRPALRRRMEQICREVVEVGRNESIELNAQATWQRVLEVCQETAANISSMLQDVRSGRPTEIDAICGAVVRLAEKHRLAVPELRRAWREVLKVES